MHHPASRPSRFWLSLAALAAATALAACSGISSRPAPTKPAPAPAVEAPAQPPEPTPAPVTPVTQEPITTTPAPPPTKPYATAALLLPLSGPSAVTGTALFNAAQLALFEIADKNFTLLPYDTKGTPEGAAAAAQQALANGPDIVLGPLFSGEVKTAAPLARAAHVPMLALSADRTVAGDGVYVLGFLPGPQALRVAAYAARQGKTRLAILAPANEYGQRVAEEVVNGSGARGIAIAGVEFYDEATADLTQPLKHLARGTAPNGDLAFDALLLPDEGARLRTTAASLPLLGIDLGRIKLLGTMLWVDANTGSEPALAGGWFPAPAAAAHAAFDDRYAKAFGPKPPRIASLAYDATALAAVLARKTPRDFGAAALTNPSGFAGVDGLFRLLADGTAERGYAIDEVVKGGPPREIDPAPNSFGGSGS